MTNISEKCYIGIDVSKPTLDVYILPSRKYMQFPNDPKGITKLSKKLEINPLAKIVVEATGGYEKPLTKTLQKAGLSVAIVNPRLIRDFAKAMNQLAKTDELDSKIMSIFAEKMEPRPSQILTPAQEQVVELSTRREQLKKMINMESNRLDKVSKDIAKPIKKHIKFMQKELDSTNNMMNEVIKNDPQFSQKKVILSSMKGVGAITAADLIARLPELGTLGHRQISALAGLAPLNRDSGAFRGKRTPWGGRADVRTALFMATIVAIRHNPQLKDFYTHLLNKGKCKMVAITACMHKMLIILNAMLRDNKEWQPAC